MAVLQSLRTFTVCLFFAALGFSSAAVGQAAEEAEINGQPLMYMKAGKVDGCGVRFIAVLLYPNLRTGRGIDASINVWASGFAAVKGLSYDIDVAAMQSGIKPKVSNLERFWLKVAGKAATHPSDGRFNDSEDAGAKIYAVPVDAALELYEAIFEGEPVTIGLKRSEDRGERLYFGKVKMSEAEQRQAMQCLSDLTK